MSRTIATLTAVVALTLAACGSGTSDTTTTIPTTTTDTRGWSDEAFRDLMVYCQAAEFGFCASSLIAMRDIECSVEATYRIIDDIESFDDLMRDELHPAGDCLGYDPPHE